VAKFVASEQVGDSMPKIFGLAPAGQRRASVPKA
jgi:hypothetical protein